MKELFILLLILLWTAAEALAGEIETVSFPSLNLQKTLLIGYLWKPEGFGPFPAVVLLHGRAGAYASKAKEFSAETLQERHKMWGEFLANSGYVALLVDSFKPRGYARGFPKGSYGARPKDVSDQTVRPFDAYGALEFLRQRKDIVPERTGVLGWSNGGMTVLATLTSNREPESQMLAQENTQNVMPSSEEEAQVFVSAEELEVQQMIPTAGFRAAIALYPGCIPQVKQPNYHPYAPLIIFTASLDDEVSPKACAALTKRMSDKIQLVHYDGATHAYDLLPIKTIPNVQATLDSFSRAKAFFEQNLKQQ